MYGEVLGQELPWLGDIVHAKTPQRLPVALTVEETRALMAQLSGVQWLIASLLGNVPESVERLS